MAQLIKNSSSIYNNPLFLIASLAKCSFSSSSMSSWTFFSFFYCLCSLNLFRRTNLLLTCIWFKVFKFVFIVIPFGPPAKPKLELLALKLPPIPAAALSDPFELRISDYKLDYLSMVLDLGWSISSLLPESSYIDL